MSVSSLFAQPEVPLVRSGKAVAEVIFSDQDEIGQGTRYQEASVTAAADELARTLEQISGAKVPIRRIAVGDLDRTIKEAVKAGTTTVLLGSLALKQLGELTDQEKDALSDLSGFVLKVEPGLVAIAGGAPRGTEIGVYEVLEQLGVRWFLPGPLGTVMPTRSDLVLPVQTLAEKPSFKARHFGFNALDRDPATADWKKHQREGGPYLPPAHGIRLGDDGDFETHPEFYALVDGKRVENQVCISNPEVVRRAIEETKRYFRENPSEPWIGMGPKDGSGFCQCASCQALDGGSWDPFSNERSVTDRYIWFFNQVLAGLKEEFPDKKIAFYVYHCYLQPPEREKPDPKIVAAIAPIGLCRVHGMNNPICPERSYLKGLITAWTQAVPEVYERGYWFNLADPGMAFIQVHRMDDEIPFYATQGIQGFRTECTNQWAAQGPSLYVAGQLMWNAKANSQELMGDFCQKLFGPAAVPMEAYFQLLDERLRDADYHTGSAFDLLNFYPPDFRAKASAHLKEACKLASKSPFKERVELFASGFAFTEQFAQMQQAVRIQDWEKAKAALGKLDELRAKLIDYDPPMMSPGQTESYLRRFFRLPVEQGSARVRDGNRLVVPLLDEWDFLLDPQRIGESLHYERADLTGGNWQKIPTSSTTWSDEGLRYYKGLSWYRQTVDVPEDFDGQRVFLWFGGVDESARVWVNGLLIGTSPSSAFTPFELDATPALKPGKNVVTVCVANLQTNELGTGGITSPAFFYAPAKGAAAELENLKPLRNTFP